MASATQRIKRIRNHKRKNLGKLRKRHDRLHGSTPAFPIHKKQTVD